MVPQPRNRSALRKGYDVHKKVKDEEQNDKSPQEYRVRPAVFDYVLVVVDDAEDEQGNRGLAKTCAKC